MTNCLTSKAIVHELLDPAQSASLKDLSRTLAWFDENLPKKLMFTLETSREMMHHAPVEPRFPKNNQLLFRQLADLENEVILGSYLL